MFTESQRRELGWCEKIFEGIITVTFIILLKEINIQIQQGQWG